MVRNAMLRLRLLHIANADSVVGIDVQAELRAKTGSPNLGPTHVPQALVQPPPIQRAIINRHHARRSNSGVAPKLEPGINMSPLPAPIQPHPSALSPKSRRTPSSHSASPTATASFGSQPGASPAGSDHLNSAVRQSVPPATAMKTPTPQHVGAMHGMPPRLQQMQVPGLQQGTTHVRGGVPTTTAPFYSTPSFQNHIEQLGKLTRSFFFFALSFLLPSLFNQYLWS